MTIAAKCGHYEIVDFLLNRNPPPLLPLDVNIRNKYGISALHRAASAGRSDYIKKLLALGAIPQDDHYGRSPLYMAIRSAENNLATIKAVFDALGDLDINATDPRARLLMAAVSRDNDPDDQVFRFLLDKGVDPYQKDNANRTVVYYALKKKKIDLVQLVFSKFPPRREEHGCIFIFAAAFKPGDDDDDDQHLKQLLDENPDLDINAGKNEKHTVLHLAAVADLATPTLVNHKDLELDILDDDGRSPLYLAARYGSSKFIRAILAREGPRPNMELKNGKFQTTALFVAVASRREEMIKLLIEEGGANVYARDKDNDGVFHWTLGDPRLVSMLIKTQLHPSVDTRTKTMAYAVAELGRYMSFSGQKLADILLGGEGEDTEFPDVMTDQDGKTVLSWAAEMGYEEAVRAILSDISNHGRRPRGISDTNSHGRRPRGISSGHGVNYFVNKTDKYGRTPLSLAAEQGHREIVEILVSETRADLDREDRGGRSALYYAAVNGRRKVVEFLLERGARRWVLGDRDLVQVVHDEMAKGIDELDSAEKEVTKSNRRLTKARARRDRIVSAHMQRAWQRNAETPRVGDSTSNTPHTGAVTENDAAAHNTPETKEADIAIEKATLALVRAEITREDAKQRLTLQSQVHDFLRSNTAFMAAVNFSGGLAEDTMKATVLHVRENKEYSLSQDISVRKLLAGGGRDERGDALCQWMHLPANNVGPSYLPYYDPNLSFSCLKIC